MQFAQPILAKDGIELLDRKTVVASGLDSHDWQFRIPTMLRQRAYWSATIESARFLQRTKDFLSDFLTSSREEVTRPDGTKSTALKVGSKADFIQRAREFALENGLDQAVDPKDRGTIKDITSEQRLGLVFEVQTQSAWNYTRWVQGQDPDVLDEFPADEFVRVVQVKQERPLHVQNTGVIRLKNDIEFWTAMNSEDIGGFGVPWGPWGFNSGMGVRDVDRAKAEELGLLKPGQAVEPAHKDLNNKLEASTKNLDPEITSWLKSNLGNRVTFENDRVRWTGQDDSFVPAPPPRPASPAPARPQPKKEDALPQAFVQPPAGTPVSTSKPVSEALTVEVKSPEHQKRLEATKAIIDGVHGDGILPKIPVNGTVPRGTFGVFEFVGTKPAKIGVSASSPHPELTMIHEVGHFIDHSGLGAGRLASVSAAELAPWFEAVRASSAYADILKHTVGPRQAYLSSRVECWARSYAQWIAVHSDHPTLKSQVASIRAGDWPYRQWSDDDFKPIDAEITKLFKAKGWI